jgi:hypothetical protein
VGKVIMINHLTLDGVVQAPGRPKEDADSAGQPVQHQH